MSAPSSAAVNGISSTAAQSGVTPTSQMNGIITSQSRDSAERSPPPAAAAAAAAVERPGRAGDVIKSSLARPPDPADTVSSVNNAAQHSDSEIAASYDR